MFPSSPIYPPSLLSSIDTFPRPLHIPLAPPDTPPKAPFGTPGTVYTPQLQGSWLPTPRPNEIAKIKIVSSVLVMIEPNRAPSVLTHWAHTFFRVGNMGKTINNCLYQTSSWQNSFEASFVLLR